MAWDKLDIRDTTRQRLEKIKNKQQFPSFDILLLKMVELSGIEKKSPKDIFLEGFNSLVEQNKSAFSEFEALELIPVISALVRANEKGKVSIAKIILEKCEEKCGASPHGRTDVGTDGISPPNQLPPEVTGGDNNDGGKAA